MKKIISKIFLGLLCFSYSFALEWGGLVSVKAVPTVSKNFSFQGIGDAYLWMNSALNQDKTLFLNSEMQYEFSFLNKDQKNTFTNFFDIDLLKLSGTFELDNNSVLDFSFGRYQVADSTGAIFAQESDGLFVSYSMPTVVVSGYFGYTGLLNGLKVQMLDKNGVAQALDPKDTLIYGLAHPYLPANVTVEFPVIFNNQSVSFQANAFFDLKDYYNRYYANVVMSGPVSGSAFYKLASSFGSENFTDLMNYTSVSLLLFPMSNISVSVGGEYASGNHLIFDSFRGFSSRVAYGSANSPQTSALFMPNASFVWTKGNNIYTGVTGKFILAGDKFENTAAELGTDLIYNLFSDLQVGLNIDWYVPFGISDDAQKFSATLNVDVSF